LTAETIAVGLTTYVVLLFSLSVHESAHAWTAHRMGDDTAVRQGRVSLNPLVHIDPIGTLLIPLLQIFWGGIPLIGWAKPTPVISRNFRNLARGHILVAGAGPASNLALALAFTLALFLSLRAAVDIHGPVIAMVTTGIQMNVILALFNLIPLPPLDGSWIASWGLPRAVAAAYDRVVVPYGSMLLLVLVATGGLGYLIGPIARFVVTVLYSIVI
jgi:Zn-dependent protease